MAKRKTLGKILRDVLWVYQISVPDPYAHYAAAAVEREVLQRQEEKLQAELDRSFKSRKAKGKA